MAGGADTAILQRYQRGYNPKSRANLLPDFKPGTRNTKGKRPTLKTKIRRFLEEDIGTYLFDGSPINREDRLLLQAIEDAENCTEPIDRHRALNIVLDRLYGKPPQTTNTKLSGSLDHNLTGFIAFADIANFPGGFPAMKEAIAKGQYLPCEDGVKLNPDFVEIAESGSESQETE